MDLTPTEQQQNAVDDSATSTTSRKRPWRLLVIGAVAVLLAVFIATQVLGVLFAIVFPPNPPLPENVAVITHSSDAYGVDDWLYGTDLSGCEVLYFYQAAADSCRIAPMTCSVGTSLDVRGEQTVGRCTGTLDFSLFAMRWNVTIGTGYSEDGVTRIRLTREIFWTGAVPPREMPVID